MEGYDNADGKKKYVNNYFKNLYIINGDRNLKEIELTSAKRIAIPFDDEKRTEYLKQFGIKVIRISNLDVLKNFEGVCIFIDNVIKQSLSQLR